MIFWINYIEVMFWIRVIWNYIYDFFFPVKPIVYKNLPYSIMRENTKIPADPVMRIGFDGDKRLYREVLSRSATGYLYPIEFGHKKNYELTVTLTVLDSQLSK